MMHPDSENRCPACGRRWVYPGGKLPLFKDGRCPDYWHVEPTR